MLLPLQRPSIGADELDAVAQVFASRWLGQGARCADLEQALAQALPALAVVGCANGTAALHLALAALQMPAGAEVILPSLTFAATVQAVIAAGLQPVFADVLPHRLTLDPASVRRVLSERTGALLPVHYQGVACDMSALREICDEHGLWLVDDAAHAFGCHHRGLAVGHLAHLSCHSFDPIKNITCGEGGAVSCNDASMLAALDRVRQMRTLGIDADAWTRLGKDRNSPYDVAGPGWRYHLPDLNAAIGLVQLRRWPQMAQRRRDIAAAYDEAFAGLPGVQAPGFDLTEVVPFMYVVQVDERDRFVAALRAANVSTGLHYWPNHWHSAFKACRRDALPQTESAAKRIVTLPLFVDQTEPEVQQVIDAVRSAALACG